MAPWVGFDVNDYEASFGSTPARLFRREIRYGLRALYGVLAATRVSLPALGLDVLGGIADLNRDGTLTRPPREGDRAVFGQSPGSEVNSDTWSTHIADFAPFLSLVVRLGSLRLEPGLRAAATLNQCQSSVTACRCCTTARFSPVCFHVGASSAASLSATPQTLSVCVYRALPSATRCC